MIGQSGRDERDVPGWIRGVLSSRAPKIVPDDTFVRASVLLPLFAGALGDIELWLVRRADDLRTHQGQVALPGGKRDATDADLEHTALREAYEEIGLAPSAVRILGTLDDHVTVTGFVVTPHVGWIADPFVPAPQAREVARVFAVPLSTFLVEATPRTVALSPTIRRIVPSYEAEGETIWGATARIVSSFAELLARADARDT